MSILEKLQLPNSLQHTLRAAHHYKTAIAASILLLSTCGSAVAVELVGTTPGQFSVSDTGAANYTIPIGAPRATGGMRPEISLTYNHRGGNGIAGQGWTVGGLSKITRCPKTIVQDGKERGVRYDLEDRFCLDGQRLMLTSGTYGVAGSEYRTEIDNFERIVAAGIQGNGPQIFTVTDRNGTQHVYGHSNNSSLFGGSNSYSNWARYVTRDAFSNEIQYFYDVPTSPGEQILDRIEYTGNSLQGLSPRYEVKFEYGDRPDSDKRSGFNFGVIWSKDKRLTKVTTKNLSAASVWETIHDYKLDYAVDSTVVTGRSQLVSVQQCQGTTCLPKTTFDWQNAVVGWESAVSSDQSSIGHTSTKVGDFDNDGQQDLYVVVNGEWQILRALAGKFDDPLVTNKNVAAGITRKLDFNGDGRMDLLFEGTDSKWHVYQATTNGFNEVVTTISTVGVDSFRSHDADGDGRDDLLYITGNKVYLRRSTGTDFEATAQLMISTPATNMVFKNRTATDPNRQLDFNGDGRGDILLKETTTTPGGRRGGGTVTIEWYAYTMRDFGYAEYDLLDGNVNRMFPDINGDGLDDVAYYSSGSWRHALSNGQGFDAEVSSAISDTNSSKAIFADYDGDGRDDLIRATSSNWVVHKSDGDGFESIGVSIGGPDPLNSQAMPMDVSGSGYDELVASYSNLWQIRDHKSPAADIVTKMTDGLGNYFEPTYSSLAGMADYLGTASGTFPMRRFSQPYYVVDAYSANDGIGGTYSIDYKYWDAMIHTEGYDFLGFDASEATDSRDGTYRRTEFAQEVPYFGMVDDFYIKQPDGTTINRTNPSLNNTPIGSFPNLRYFTRPESLTVELFEVGGVLNGQQIRKIIQDPTYDVTYGNVTSNTTTRSSGQVPGDTYTTVINFQYDNFTTPWCLGLATQVQITRSAPGVTTEDRTYNNTYNSSNCALLTSTDASDVNLALQLMTSLTFDGYGNIEAIILDSADGAAADRKTELSYDSWGHLPLSQTNLVDNQPDSTISRVWDYVLVQPLSMTNVGGLTTDWQYDSFGRLTNETRPDGTTSAVNYVECSFPCEYTSASFFIEKTDSSGFVTRNFRDSFGRSVGAWSYFPTGTKARLQLDYDQRGFVDKQFIPWIDGEEPKFFIDYNYDLLGRQIQEDRPIDADTPSGAVSTVTYQGLTKTVTNAENQSAILQLDPLGRMDQITDNLGGITKYAYTAFDNLSMTWDPANNLTTIDYNGRGEKISMSSPDMGVWTYDWTVFGEQASETDAKGQITTFEYNQLGLITKRTESEGTTTWSYFTTSDHKLWLPSSVASPGGFSESYTYESLGRPSSVTTNMDSASYTTDLSYHTSGAGKGRLSRLTYPSSTTGNRFKIDYDYDQWGHISSVKNGDTPTTVYYQLSEADAFGRERLATLGNGVDEDRVFDRANGFLQTIRTGPNLTATIQNLSYQWDKAGNLIEREDLNQSKIEDFDYDGLSRLTSAKLNNQTTLSISYDNTGNIITKSDVGTYSYGAGTAGPHALTEVTGVRPGTYSYDSNGNMIDRAGDAVDWASFNRPVRIDYGVSDYTEIDYGPGRHRFKQTAVTNGATTTTHYVGSHFETEVSGGVTLYRHHILAGGGTVAIHTRSTGGSDETQYVHRDHLGSVVGVTDSDGDLQEEISFDAFGKRRNSDWTADIGDLQFAASHLTARGYTGHEHLDNVRLIHMNGRVQDPILGRMISADPFIPNPFDSQSFNRYSYAVNRPLSLLDPSGFTHNGTHPRVTEGTCGVSGVDCEPITVPTDRTLSKDPSDGGEFTPPFIPNSGLPTDSSDGPIIYVDLLDPDFDDVKLIIIGMCRTRNCKFIADDVGNGNDEFVLGTVIKILGGNIGNIGIARIAGAAAGRGMTGTSRTMAPKSQAAPKVNGNSKASTNPQHRYEIVDANGDVVKTGISGKPLNGNASSARANTQVNALNRNGENVTARVVETNIPGRQVALDAEQAATNQLAREGNTLRLQQRPKPK